MRPYRRLAIAAALVLANLTYGQPVQIATATTAHPPLGFLAFTENSTELSGIVTEVEVSGLRTDFTVTDPEATFRYIKVTATLRAQTSLAPSTADIFVDVLNLGTQLTQRIGGYSLWLGQAGGAGGTTMTVTGYSALPPANYRAMVKMKRTAGLGLLTASFTSGVAQTLIVEDTGA